MDDDLAAMDDVAFLAKKRRVREAVTTAPPEEVTLQQWQELERLNAEFLRRAGMAWRDATCA
jgi:hypothetical protein